MKSMGGDQIRRDLPRAPTCHGGGLSASQRDARVLWSSPEPMDLSFDQARLLTIYRTRIKPATGLGFI